MMIEYENVEFRPPMGQPTPLHAIKEQMTLVKGWSQLVTRYSMEEAPWRDEDIRKGLTRLDAATTQLTELLAKVMP